MNPCAANVHDTLVSVLRRPMQRNRPFCARARRARPPRGGALPAGRWCSCFGPLVMAERYPPATIVVVALVLELCLSIV